MAHGMIVAAQPESTEAGAVVLKQGGNAIDAAIACALVAGVVDPQMCGIAGFGSMQVYMPKRGIHTCIDFHAKAPAATRPDQWEHLIEGEARDGFGFILRDRVNDLGYQSIAIPGSLKAYYEAQTEFGTMDWADVVQPAIDHATVGFVVRPRVHYWWVQGAMFGRVDNLERLRYTESGRRLYFNADGNLHGIGTRVKNPDMARTLRRIATHGADIFYTGEVAQEVVADMSCHGGLLSLEDLQTYRTTRVDPLWGSYRGLQLATCHPPGGGVMVVEMLNVLEHFDLRALGHNTPEYIRIVAEAMKRATRDKDAHVGDPAFVDIPLDWLTSKAYAAEMASEIQRGERATVDRLLFESPDTTHLVVVDAEGNAVSMTHSLGMPSGVITEGLGFMYNGCMAVFDPRLGRAGSLAPGKSRFSSLCPTMVFKDGELFTVIGAPGGTQIAIGVMQAILNVVDFDMSMLEAVSAPRFSATSNMIDVSNRIPNYVTNQLEAQGYEVVRSPLSYAFAAVHGIKIEDRVCTGGADPSMDGMALAVDLS